MMHRRSRKFFSMIVLILLVASIAACGGGNSQVPVTQEVAPTQVVQPAPTEPPAAPTAEPVQTEAPAAPTAEPTLAEPTPVPASDPELPQAIKEIFTGTPVSYSSVDDFEEAWAQIGWYQYWDIDEPPTNFVIRTDAAWSSASDTANWDESGCGFVFHATDERNHALAYLGLDGNVYVSNVVDAEPKLVGSAYYDKLEVPDGSAELMLMVNGDKITFFVNGQKVFSGIDSLLTSKLDSAHLALTLLSGTNKDFGTRCQMLNTDLWDLGK